MLSGITIFNDDIDDGKMVESEREFTESHLTCHGDRSARASGFRFKTQRTDVLRSVLCLREQGWDLGHIERFRVEHGVIGAVVHCIKDDLKFDNFVSRRQLGFHD